MKKRIQIAGVIFCTFGVVLLISDQPLAEQPLPKPNAARISDAPTALMRSKMNASQQVLEGLLRKDFAAITRGAAKMRKISEAAEWPRARDRVYEHFGAEFRRQCNHLEKLSKQRNHEGATFVFLQMTTTCVHCHDYARDSLRVAKLRARDNVQLIPASSPQ